MNTARPLRKATAIGLTVMALVAGGARAANLSHNLSSTLTLAGDVSYDSVYVGSGGGTASTIVDATGTSSFTSSGTQFYIGAGPSGVGSMTGTLKLGISSSITATQITIGGLQPDSNGTAGHAGLVTTLASSITTINTANMALGTGKGNGTQIAGYTGGNFVLGSGATLNLYGLTGSNSRAVLILGRLSVDTAARGKGAMNLSAGTANLVLSELSLGKITVNNGLGDSTVGTLTLGASAANHLDISGAGSVMRIAYNSHNTTTTTGTLTIGNLDNASSITSTDNGTAILIAYRSAASGTITGTFNLNGGTLTITTSGSAIAGGGGTSRLNLSSCTLVAGASSTTWIQDLTTATLANTVTFNTGSYDITVPQSFSGTGGLNIAGSGTLVLAGANTFTGPVTVSGGTLGGTRLVSAAVNPAGKLTCQGGTLSPGKDAFATFAHTGAVELGAGGTLRLDLGGSSNDALTATGAVTLDGTLTIVPSADPLLLADYTLITGGSVTGRFSATNGLPADCSIEYTGTSVVLHFVASSPPPTPAGLAATPGNAKALLTWSPSVGATGYNLWRAGAEAGPYAMVEANHPDMAYTDTGLANATPYYYKVSATNANGESVLSAAVSVTPALASPPAPSGLSATAGNRAVQLSWAAVFDASAYLVKRAPASGGPYVTVGTTTGTGYRDAGLTNGATCYYVVTATNATGESGNASEVSATPAIPASASGSWITDGAGNWSESVNWAAGVVAVGTTGAAAFTIPITGSRTVTLDAPPWPINSMTFTSSGANHWTLAGGALDLVGAGPKITVNASSTATVAADVYGTAGLAKAGSGTLNLNGVTALGSVTVGTPSTDGGSLVVGIGGSLSVGSGLVNTLYIVAPGLDGGAGTLDASASADFVVNVGTLGVADKSQSTGTGRLVLGANSTITAATKVSVADGYGNAVSLNGTISNSAIGTTAIHTPSLIVGRTKTNVGNVTFGHGATLTLDGIGGGRAQLILGEQDASLGSDRTARGTMDLSDAISNLTLSQLVVGRSTPAASGSNASLGLMTLSDNIANHLDIGGSGNVVLLGYSAGLPATGTLTIGNLGPASVVESTDGGTAILIGYKGGSGAAAGTLTLNGGMLTLTTTGSAIAGGGGTSTLNLNGVTLKAGAPSTTWIQGLTSATLMAGGVTLNTVGHDVTIPQAFSGSGGLTKDGTGTLTLPGVNTYNGTTLVSGGKLVTTTAATGAGAYTTAAGTTTLGVKVASAGTTLNASSLTLGAGSTLEVDFGALGVPTVPVMTVSGAVAAAAPVTVRIRCDDPGVLTPGTSWPLLQYGSLGGGGFGALILETPLPGNVAGSLHDDGTVIRLVIAETLLPLQWAAGSGDWDINTTANWIDSNSAAARYREPTGSGNAVTFEDAQSGGDTPIAVALVATVHPAGVTVDAAKHYAIGGSGKIAGAAGLDKLGAGTLTLATANEYSGATVVQQGTLRAVNVAGSATGTGALTVKAGATLEGTGRIGGVATVEGGARLAPGVTGIGLLTVDTLAVGENGVLAWDINPGGADDAIDVVTALTLPSQLTLNINLTAPGSVDGTVLFSMLGGTTYTGPDRVAVTVTGAPGFVAAVREGPQIVLRQVSQGTLFEVR